MYMASTHWSLAIFIRTPKDWWENYTVTALGNDRTDPDDKTLQYVGNVDTYDETVGYVREVAQLQYTQEWSWAEWSDELNPPSNPDVGDLWVQDDYDDSPPERRKCQARHAQQRYSPPQADSNQRNTRSAAGDA